MKVTTNLKSGNFVDDLANTSCKSLMTAANVVNNANQQANSLANNAAGWTQSAWNSVMGWLNLS